MAANRKAPFRRLYWFQSAKIFWTKKLNLRILFALEPGTRLKGGYLFAAMGRSNIFSSGWSKFAPSPQHS